MAARAVTPAAAVVLSDYVQLLVDPITKRRRELGSSSPSHFSWNRQMMPVLAVLDETGTTNRPQLSADSDFGVGVIVFESAQLPMLTDAARRIGEAVGNSDFKYKHTQRCTDARKIFIRTINSLTAPGGVFGFFSSGGSLLNEKDRAVFEMSVLGTDDGGYTAELAEQIRSGDNETHLRAFLGFFASCLITYAGSLNRRLEVHWDRRTDLSELQQFCEGHKSLFHSHPTFGNVSNLVSFTNTAQGDLSSVARLSGVLAGDIRFFFQKHGSRIWTRLADAVRFRGEPDDSLLQPDKLVEATTVARVEEPLSDRAFGEGSKDTCMVQGYTKRFIGNLVSFAAPNGIMGHLLIHHGSKWDIIQLPD